MSPYCSKDTDRKQSSTETCGEIITSYTVGLMLIHTQTWRGKDYCRLLEYLLKKLFKDGIIQNIQQYLSALCKSLTSALLFVVLCVSPPSLPFYLFTGEATNKDLSRTFAN